MEVKTGRIKAIANLGLIGDSAYGERFNYAIGEATEPGSTFKLATIAALMEDGLVSNSTTVDIGDGSVKFYNTTVKDHDKPENPIITVKRSIEESSNVAAAKLAYEHYSATPSKFYKHLQDFGFTQPVDIEVPGNAKPVLAEPKKWSGVSTAFIAHGYELQITPMHTLLFYNAIANNGVMVKPKVIEKVTEYNTTIDSFSTVVINEHLLNASTIKQLRETLEGVVENGTAKNLKTDYLRIAGKTGTAVIAQGKQGYKNGGKKIYQASFCGYFPAEDPQYSMIVVINSPGTNGYYGNVVAGSIFREVADKVYSLNLNMHKSVNKGNPAKNTPVITKGNTDNIKAIYSFLGNRVNNVQAEWSTVAANGSNVTLTSTEINNEEVPDVTGMSLKDALYLLEGLGLKVSVVGKGSVKKQSIAAGERITRGMQVVIELS